MFVYFIGWGFVECKEICPKTGINRYGFVFLWDVQASQTVISLEFVKEFLYVSFSE